MRADQVSPHMCRVLGSFGGNRARFDAMCFVASLLVNETATHWAAAAGTVVGHT